MNPSIGVPLFQYSLAGGVAIVSGWWTILSIVALPRPREAAVGASSNGPRLAVIVPAHNEEPLIEKTVGSLRHAAGFLSPTPTIIVVADNCTDGTADQAEDAGANVLIRTDESLRGKSFALEFAIEHLRNLPTGSQPDAVVIVDADTVVSANLFERISSRLQDGADVVQVHYAAAHGPTPVVRLRRLALGLVHWSRPLGASRLGLPTTLKGNGMAFRWALIRDGFPGSGITEDAAATLSLARQGTVVVYEPHATVWGLMASTYRDAAVQDERWEGGRIGMTRASLSTGIQLLLRGRIRAAAACVELASPPLTLVVAASTLSMLLASVGAGSTTLGGAAFVLTLTYVGVGLAATRPSREDLAAMVHAPRFIVHKLRTYARLLRGKPKAWERTLR